MSHLAPTGELFLTFQEMGFPSRDDAISSALDMFNRYQTNNKGGTVYWRVFPEFKDLGADRWRYYMRLLISDREVK